MIDLQKRLGKPSLFCLLQDFRITLSGTYFNIFIKKTDDEMHISID